MSAQEREDLVARLRAVMRASGSESADSGISGTGGGGTATLIEPATLTDALEGLHPADIAEAMDQLSDEDALAIFHALDNARAAEGGVDDDASADGADDAANAVDAEHVEAVVVLEPGLERRAGK